MRDVPDVSFFSGSFMGDEGYSQNFNAAWSICSDNTVNGDSSSYTDCLVNSGTAGCGGTCSIDGTVTTTTPVGGTSTAAPSMAGTLALVIQSQGGQRLGQADYAIYNIAANHPSDFHDIAQGNNSVLCTAGATSCGSNDFMNGYNAGTGYDLATGIGSIDVAKLVNDWATVKFAPTTTSLTAGTSTSSLSSSPLTVAHGGTVYFKVAVSPSMATGNVVLTTSSSEENSDSIMSAPITNGAALFSTQALPGGTYTLYAQYGGDSTNSGSQSKGIQITVLPETSTMQFNINVYDPHTGNLTATSPTGAAYGSQFYADITPYGGTEGLAKGNPATGTVTLSQNGAQRQRSRSTVRAWRTTCSHPLRLSPGRKLSRLHTRATQATKRPPQPKHSSLPRPFLLSRVLSRQMERLGTLQTLTRLSLFNSTYPALALSQPAPLPTR